MTVCDRCGDDMSYDEGSLSRAAFICMTSNHPLGCACGWCMDNVHDLLDEVDWNE
jgi:hypothetical protein